MPTLIRLLVTLLILVGLAYAGMFALVLSVKPTPKETTIRIPTNELLGESAPGLPGQTRAPAPAPAAEPAPAAPADAAPAEAPASP
ncbi:hypothetical protein [Devosia sp. 1566]|uniref:hypothetical protein n=1 Tax=Devosia sp. 1566 TaxID=2499144 RepID=UPI0032B880F7